MEAEARYTFVGASVLVLIAALVAGLVWLKNVGRPYLNRRVTVAGFSDVVAPARGGVFDVLGRRLPVAVTDVRGSRRYELTLVAADAAEASAIEFALSFGDTMLLHVPAGCVVPASMHVFVGDLATSRHSARATRRFLSLPLTEVDAPAAGVVGATITWQGVMNAYPTWADLLAAQASWLTLLESISAPSDEVVG